jgi:GntR family transcriptional regulator/MocR family aminotransferase
VFITTGSQQAHDLVVRLLADPGDPIWMEEPGYAGIRSALTANGGIIQNVPVDDNGMDVDAGIEHFVTPRLICVTPARQFPAGVVMSAQRRAKLLAFAASAGAWIVEDDFDSEISFETPPTPTLCAHDTSERVILIGTFSTTLVPSLRLGYVIVPRDLIPAFEIARSTTHGHASLIEQMVLAEMLTRGSFTAHMRKMRVLYRSRQTALIDALSNELGYRPGHKELAGGMHVILPFKGTIDDGLQVAHLAKVGIVTRPLSPHYALSKRRQGLLLGFAAFREQEIRKSMSRLGDVIGRNAIGQSLFDA